MAKDAFGNKIAKVKTPKEKAAPVEAETPPVEHEFSVGDFVLVDSPRIFAGGPEKALGVVTHTAPDGTYEVAVLHDEYTYRKGVEL